MTLIFLFVSLGLIWINLIGLGLLGGFLVKDYAVSRIASLFGLCLVFFFIEHFHGFGPRLWLLPISTLVSVGLILRNRESLRRNWALEGAFAFGLFYCLAWRYTFPNISTFGEQLPDLVFIQDYFSGMTLPAADRWMPPFDVSFYYGFQFYAAALMGRWFRLDPALSYQLGYCVLTGLISCSIFATVRRLAEWRPAAWIVTGALALGGCGLGLVIHLSLKSYIQPTEMARYLGVVRDPHSSTAFGLALDRMMYAPGVPPLELPVDPLSFLIFNGEFHPPLLGFLILAFSLLTIACLVDNESASQGRLLSGLLAATVPLSFIGNTWVFPLQTAVVLGWFVYCFLMRRKVRGLAGLVGAFGASSLAYPFIVTFTQQTASRATELRVTPHVLHSTPAEWLSVFWPIVGLAVLGLFTREKRALTLFFICLLAVLLAGTEFFYNHDNVYSATWERYNSTLKWWGWVYAAGIIGIGGVNLGSRNRFCRYGSVVMILLPCAQIYDYGRYFSEAPQKDKGRLEGSYWLTRDVAVRDLVFALKARPDGICLDSSLTFDNTDSSVIPIFSGKCCYMGWPEQEGIWREFNSEIRLRVGEINAFYAGRMSDPLAWLLRNNVRYVLWLQKDNDNLNARFIPLWNKIQSRYVWRHYAGNDADWAVGFWELAEPHVSR